MITRGSPGNNNMIRIDQQQGQLPMLQQILHSNQEEEQKVIAEITQEIFKQFATKDQLNIQHVLLTIQNDRNLMKKYSAAYICLREYMKAGLNQGHHQSKTESKTDFMNLLRGYQIPQKALSFFSDSQFATFYEMLDLQKEGTLDQADFERAFQLMKNMKESNLKHGLDANQKTNLQEEQIKEIALFLETLDSYSQQGEQDKIISPQEYYAALTFEQPLSMQESTIKSKLKGLTRRDND